MVTFAAAQEAIKPPFLAHAALFVAGPLLHYIRYVNYSSYIIRNLRNYGKIKSKMTEERQWDGADRLAKNRFLRQQTL